MDDVNICFTTNTTLFTNVGFRRRHICSRIDMQTLAAHPFLTLILDLLTSVSTLVYSLPSTVTLPTLALIVLAVFLLEDRQTDTQTDRRKDTTERSTHAAAITSVDNKPDETIMGGPVDLWCGRTAVCLKTAALVRSLRPATEHFGPLFIANWQSATRICLHSPRDGR